MALTIIKRDGSQMAFNKSKIELAVSKAIFDVTRKVSDGVLETKVADMVEETSKYINAGELTVEDIQNLVEKALMKLDDTGDIAKAYITFRQKRDQEGHDINSDENVTEYKLLLDDFIRDYKNKPNPFPSTLGELVFYRTYSRWLKVKKRREYWHETVRRAVEYNTNLVAGVSKEEAQKLFDNIYNLKQFLSGRTLYSGNTHTTNKFIMSNYNCAYTTVDDIEAFTDTFYLLLLGSGVGFRILKDDVAKLPRFRMQCNDVELDIIHQAYNPVPKKARKELTELTFQGEKVATITVGDSKLGWVSSLKFLLQLITDITYNEIDTIIVNYDNVRPHGEKLKTFGGTASGHMALKTILDKVFTTIQKRFETDGEGNYVKLKSIDCLDIKNSIAEGVVVGGTRRSAEIALGDSDDQDFLGAKTGMYTQTEDGVWILDKSISHRQMSNNSIYYKTKPSREMLHWQIEQMRFSGEPAFINGEAGAKRRDNMNGVNPCGEILLDSNGMCNLTTVNVFAFVNPDGTLDLDGILEAQRLSARAGYRMTCVTLELPKWDMVQKRDRLVGCSLTGWQDMVNAVHMSVDDEIQLMKALRKAAQDAANEYADSLGLNRPILVTTIKPEGSLSQLPTVSSGLHYSHSQYYMRRVRISTTNALIQVLEDLGYKIYPEVGQDIETCKTKVVEFPIKAPNGATKYDVSALKQLENYKMFMEHYVDHNASITVHVRENEWELVEQWMWDNWDDVIGVSFLSLDDSFYELLPYEAITEEEYNESLFQQKAFNPALISKYEIEEQAEDLASDECESGICPVR